MKPGGTGNETIVVKVYTKKMNKRKRKEGGATVSIFTDTEGKQHSI